MNLRFLLPALLGLSAFAAGEAPDPLAKYRPDWPTPDQAGPILGDRSASGATLWFRCPPGTDKVRLKHGLDDLFARDAGVQTADERHDRCVRWTLSGLSAQTAIRYRIEDAKTGKVLAGPHTFWTAPASNGIEPTTLMIASCADEREGSASAWRQAGKERIDAVALIGDTPYIDSTRRDILRLRHRDFLSTPGLVDLCARVPLYSVWDDHDFGADNADGRLKGKEESLAVFKDYRVNPSYGDGVAGVYHRFQSGFMDVFMLDTRYFAGLEKNPDAKGAPSALGTAQWKWLTEGIKTSTHPFKVIVSGMIWHDGADEKKADCWARYAGEREALFRFIGANKITGVTVVGGDIHESAVVEMPTEGLAGYPIVAWTVSPLNDKVIKGNHLPREGLVYRLQEPNVMLLLTCGPGDENEPAITGNFINGAGKRLFEMNLHISAATPRDRN